MFAGIYLCFLGDLRLSLTIRRCEAAFIAASADRPPLPAPDSFSGPASPGQPAGQLIGRGCGAEIVQAAHWRLFLKICNF